MRREIMRPPEANGLIAEFGGPQTRGLLANGDLERCSPRHEFNEPDGNVIFPPPPRLDNPLRASCITQAAPGRLSRFSAKPAR